MLYLGLGRTSFSEVANHRRVDACSSASLLRSARLDVGVAVAALAARSAQTATLLFPRIASGPRQVGHDLASGELMCMLRRSIILARDFVGGRAVAAH